MCIPERGLPEDAAVSRLLAANKTEIMKQKENEYNHVNSQLTNPRQPVESYKRKHHITIQLNQE
jgi:hypothetical protein